MTSWHVHTGTGEEVTTKVISRDMAGFKHQRPKVPET